MGESIVGAKGGMGNSVEEPTPPLRATARRQRKSSACPRVPWRIQPLRIKDTLMSREAFYLGFERDIFQVGSLAFFGPTH